MRTTLLQGHRRFSANAWHTNKRQPRREASSTAKRAPEFLEPLPRDVRLRNGSNCPLPLPPALKPITASTKRSWKEPKPDPDLENLTPFQEKLYQNPYAHALATPVRQCSASVLRLPSDFLLSLQVKLHPTTSVPWLVPANLATKTNNHGYPVRYLARESMFANLTRVSKDWRRTLPIRMADSLGPTAFSKIVWREDMPALLLSMLRKQLVTSLRWFFGRRSNFLVPCKSTSPVDLDGIDDVSCILYLHTLTTEVDRLHAEMLKIVLTVEREADKIAKRHRQTYSSSKKSSEPPPHVPRLKPSLRFPPLNFPTTRWRGQSVPVYSLFDLLGEDHMVELLKDTKFQDERWLVIRASRVTRAVQTRLLQLQVYCAKYEP